MPVQCSVVIYTALNNSEQKNLFQAIKYNNYLFDTIKTNF